MQSLVLFLCRSITLTSPWLTHNNAAINSSNNNNSIINNITNNINSGSGSGTTHTEKQPHQSPTDPSVGVTLPQSSTFSHLLFNLHQLSISALDCVAVLAVNDNDKYSDDPSLCAIDNTNGYILSVKFNALLTNAVLKKLEYLHVTYLRAHLQQCQQLQHHLSSTTTDNHHVKLSLLKTMSATLLLMNSCFGCLIDLHSSDHIGILQNYKKLKMNEKMKFFVNLFQNYFNYYNNIMNTVNNRNNNNNNNNNNNMSTDEGNDDDNNNKEPISSGTLLLGADQAESVAETLENLLSFIEYKTEAVDNHR
jgi:hypothetical protein